MTKTQPTVTFKARIKQGCVNVPVIKRRHCDMIAFRSSSKFGSYANSDLFQQYLHRELRRAGVGARLYLDCLPDCVEVDDSNFLAVFTITLPE